MNTGRFYSATIVTPTETTLKSIAVHIGEKQEAAILFDTELLRVSCGWTGEFLQFNPARYGIIAPPRVAGPVVFSSPRQPGWARQGQFQDPRPKPFGPLPREWAKYRGLHLHGDRVVFEYTVGPKSVVVLESPWIEMFAGEKVFSRELEIEASEHELELLVAAEGSPVRLICDSNVATLDRRANRPITAKITKHNRPVSLKLFFPFSVPSVSSVFQKEGLETQRTRRAQSNDTEKQSLRRFLQPGPARWTAGITTRGVVSDKDDPFVVDTLTLPFDNPYKALMFVSGHDFFFPPLPKGGPGGVDESASGSRVTPPSPPLLRWGKELAHAAICTLHGDVWLVRGIDDKLEKLTWKRFATGLFQPLGLKIVNNQIYVVGRDQITRLHDLNNDGEADWYENFNNDAQVSANGHEYVTCLETDSEGWFYFLKGNCDGKHDHDGCLLRVSPDGKKLEVLATGFRNANGLGIWQEPYEKHNVITVAPQEGEWTPGSAIFSVEPGGFYGYTPSAHRSEPPQEFIPPICWIPRLQDNSSGSQVQIPIGAQFGWQALEGLPLHLSYGSCRMFLLLREPFAVGGETRWQGGTVPLSVLFESGVMRGRFRWQDNSLYVSGLRGWVSSAAKDGCFQRVRINNSRLDLPVGFETYPNGLLIRFSDWLDVAAAADIDNYRVQRWNYRWSAAYGSPEFKVSNSREEGRDEVEVLSATHIRNLKGGDAVFLEMADMRPVNQLSIQMTLRNVLDQPIERRLDATINKIWRDPFPLERKPERARPGQLTDDLRAKLVPGLRMTFDTDSRAWTGDSADRIVRMAAWRFEPHELKSLAAKLPPQSSQLRISAEGYLVVPRRGMYQVATEGDAPALIRFGGSTLDLSEPRDVELVKGFNKFWIQQRVSRTKLDQPIALRLLWSSSDFETEPIPPTALFCESLPVEVEQLRRGRELFAEHQCVRCHRVADNVLKSKSAMPELLAEAPDLIGIGSRLRPEWLTKWLLDPKSLRSDAHTPRPFPMVLTEEHIQQLADLVAYLSSLKAIQAQEPNPSAEKIDARRVRELWEDLGCIGCHALNDEPGRHSLVSARQKFQPGELARYLQAPLRHSEWSRMGDFQLSEHEAAALAQLIESQSTDKVQTKNADLPTGEIERGRAVFAKLNCRQCHRVEAGQSLPTALLPTVLGKFSDSETRGCLSPRAARPASVPDFGFGDEDRLALLTFLRQPEASLLEASRAETSRRLFASLQCATCHPRDGKSSRLPAILDEFGERGLPPEVIPNLTWTGEKLHATWTRSFLQGHTADRPRPWLNLRMPNFPAYAESLSNGFASEHGLSNEPETRRSVNFDLVPIGEALAARAGLLDCRQCHAIGALPPTGDKNTLLAPGINFSQTRERMRWDFFRRFTLDPPRYDVTTRMPKRAADGRTTKVTEVFDGDARRQFEAVWHFIQASPSQTHDP